MLCLHGPEGKCVNCLQSNKGVDKRKHLSFNEFLEKRRAKCEHSFSAQCVNCVPPAQVSYKLKPNCTKHRPWPHGEMGHEQAWLLLRCCRSAPVHSLDLHPRLPLRIDVLLSPSPRPVLGVPTTTGLAQPPTLPPR